VESGVERPTIELVTTEKALEASCDPWCSPGGGGTGGDSGDSDSCSPDGYEN